MADRQTTHAPGCWGWGPRHYECALREIEALRAEVDVLKAENARLRDEAASALALLARMRAACGDDGRRMQDEMEAYLRELRADAERLDFLDQCREGTLRLDGPRVIPAYQRWGGTATHKDARAAIDAARQGFAGYELTRCAASLGLQAGEG